VEEFLTPLSLLMPAFSLPRAPRELTAAASLHEERSPTAPSEDEAHSFGGWLEPRYIIRARALDQ
jgi:hypothetical protein